MATIIVRHKTNGMRGVIVGFATNVVNVGNQAMLQPIVAVTWIDDGTQDPAVHCVAQEDIIADEVLDDGGNRIDAYDDGEDAEEEETPASDEPQAPGPVTM